MDRRNFILSAMGGAAGLLRSAGLNAAPQDRDLNFSYRTLGKTGLRVPVISMGVMNADNPQLVKAALDSGIVHLDTAHGYQRGRNEEMIGSVVRDKPRESFIIATKVPGGDRDKQTGAYTDADAPDEFLEKLDISLTRLGLKYVDILYLHGVRSRKGALHEPLMEALINAKKTGRTRHIGLSTHSHEPEVIRAAAESGVYELVLTAYNFKQDHREEVGRAISEAAEAGLGIIGMKSIPGGGYVDKERQKPLNVKAALKWVLQNEHVHTIIPGFTTFDQLHTDLQVMSDLKLNKDEIRDLEAAMSINALYCQGCEFCLEGCSGGMPLPELMRARMYAYGYKNLTAAHDLLSELKIPAGGCNNCVACTAVCKKSFNLRENALDIMRLRNLPRELLV